MKIQSFKFGLVKAALVFTVSFIHNSSLAQDSDIVLLSGKISSSAKQIVNAPKTSRWQTQIQWIPEEGSIVEQGELLAVFDGAMEQTQLEQTIENIDRLNLELSQLSITQEQNLIEAQGRFKLAEMEVKKARIEASIPDNQVSKFEKGQFELALQRALLEQVKSEDALKRAQEEKRTQIRRKRLDIMKAEEQMLYLQELLGRMNVIAQHTGPVSYAIHPWYGSKITAGNNVSASWKVLDLQANTSFQIESFVHELDAIGLDTAATVSLSLDAYPKVDIKGKIAKISSQSEKKPLLSNSAYYPIVIDFEPPQGIKLLPGMSVRIKLDKKGNLNAANY